MIAVAVRRGVLEMGAAIVVSIYVHTAAQLLGFPGWAIIAADAVASIWAIAAAGRWFRIEDDPEIPG